MQDVRETIRVGIVGAGANTRSRHIPGLQAIDGVEVVSVANRRRDSSERVAGQFGVSTVYDSWEELVNAPDSDAIVIGTWPYLHCPVTLAALGAGKHVLCKARMAMDAEEARQMLAAAQDHPGLVTQVVPSPMTLGVDNTVKRLIGEGYLGRLLAVEVRAMNGAFLDAEAPMQWREDRDLSGLNVMSLGIWYEALMRWIGEATHVAAKGRAFVTTRRDPLTGADKAVKIPEHLVVLADMACGAQATFALSAAAGHAGANEVVLLGAEGTLRFSNGVLSGGRREEDGLREIPIPPTEAGGWRVEEEFIAAIRGSESITHTTFEDGVKYMAFTEAVARSLASEQSEPVIE
ncbi:MAG: Gfo/Idh/MocA family oxidoreductase [Lentisphaerae bacterium]|nr:Gfo/Idh/MocA family oxidoreductase [Lentisphaerota bacterium]